MVQAHSKTEQRHKANKILNMKLRENAWDDNQNRHNGLRKMSYKSKNMRGNRERSPWEATRQMVSLDNCKKEIFPSDFTEVPILHILKTLLNKYETKLSFNSRYCPTLHQCMFMCDVRCTPSLDNGGSSFLYYMLVPFCQTTWCHTPTRH
jgi:hypothetical protein